MKKRILSIMLVMVMVVCMLPAKGEAATAVPKKVITAMKNAVTENGRVIVVDNGGSKVYLFKDGKLKKSFRCTVGDYIDPHYHYFILRGSGKYTYKEGSKTYQYGVGIDRYENPLGRSIYFHSYGEKKGRVYKSVKHNPNGIGVCIDNAAYIYRYYYKDGTAVMGC